MPVIFQRGLKYTLRHYYTVAGVAGIFGGVSLMLLYKTAKWAKKEPGRDHQQGSLA
jgi:hypothetical protein